MHIHITYKNRGQNTVFANIVVTIRDNKPHGGDKCRGINGVARNQWGRIRLVGE
jgi:hypothetical protein